MRNINRKIECFRGEEKYGVKNKIVERTWPLESQALFPVIVYRYLPLQIQFFTDLGIITLILPYM